MERKKCYKKTSANYLEYKVFVENIKQVYYHTLGAVFKQNPFHVEQTEFEMKKEDLFIILKDLGLLDKEPLNADKVKEMMKVAFAIQSESLLYVEMLEMLLVVTLACPFSEEQTGMSKEVMKIMTILDKLKLKFPTEAEQFKADIEEVRKTKSYVPKFLIEEQETGSPKRETEDNRSEGEGDEEEEKEDQND